MSTRCQVTVVQEETGLDEKVTLYHHTDGYPEYMIPKIAEAFGTFSKPKEIMKGISYTRTWELGRAGMVASFLCAVDPGVFEPKDSHDLHGDIEYHYTLYVTSHEGGSVGAKWSVEIRMPNENFRKAALIKNMDIKTKRT